MLSYSHSLRIERNKCGSAQAQEELVLHKGQAREPEIHCDYYRVPMENLKTKLVSCFCNPKWMQILTRKPGWAVHAYPETYIIFSSGHMPA